MTQKIPNPNWGGARRHSGRLRRVIRLTDAGAIRLRLLQEALTLEYPTTDFTADALIDALIAQAVERMQDLEQDLESEVANQ